MKHPPTLKNILSPCTDDICDTVDEKIIFYDVTLKGTDTCFSYAVKRIGLAHLATHEPEVLLAMCNVTIVDETPRPGDILLWNNETIEYIPRHITAACAIVTRKVDTGLHFAVMERNGWFSDCVHHRNKNGHPMIRLRELAAITTKPNIVRINITT